MRWEVRWTGWCVRRVNLVVGGTLDGGGGSSTMSCHNTRSLSLLPLTSHATIRHSQAPPRTVPLHQHHQKPHHPPFSSSRAPSSPQHPPCRPHTAASSAPIPRLRCVSSAHSLCLAHAHHLVHRLLEIPQPLAVRVEPLLRLLAPQRVQFRHLSLRLLSLRHASNVHVFCALTTGDQADWPTTSNAL